MSQPTSSSASPSSNSASIMSHIASPIAAGAAIVPVFRDMIVKSSQQKGQPVSPMPFVKVIREGIKAAPTVGAIVGTQMGIQSVVEKALNGESKGGNLSSALVSSAVVGAGSAPILAVFNGQTMGHTIRQSLQKFSGKQGLAIAAQEACFVAGLSVADKLAGPMKKKFGDNKAIDYTAAFVSGAMGSLAGHPANTALTRWQSDLKVDKIGQLILGAAPRARAIGSFAVLYKIGKEILNPDSK